MSFALDKCPNCGLVVQDMFYATLSGAQEHIQAAVSDRFPGTMVTVTDTHSLNGVVIAFDTGADEQAVREWIFAEWRVVGAFGSPLRIERMPSLKAT